MIRHAMGTDIPSLKQIWNESFNDSVNYIDFVFGKVAKPNEILLYEQNGVVCAMLIMLPIKFTYASESLDGIYIYGAATLESYQNKGYMTRLLNEAERIAKEERNAKLSVLVPGEGYLFDYYARRGYRADFSLRQTAIRPAMLETAIRDDFNILIDKITADEVYDIRKSALLNVPHIEWQPYQLDNIIQDGFIYGDHVASYSSAFGKSYAVFTLYKKKLFVKECLGTSREATITCLRNVGAKYSPKGFHANMAVNSDVFPLEGKVVKFGMAKNLYSNKSMSSITPYMNLMLD